MLVLFLQPNYPPEMRDFTRGLREVGATVVGIGDTPVAGLDPKVRDALTDYVQVPRVLDEDDIVRRVKAWLDARGVRRVDRVEGMWEPVVVLAARLREALGVPGMSVDTVIGFRDKPVMRQRVAAAGVRIPRTSRARTEAEVRTAVAAIGYPVILKPVSGAGSADTYRVDTPLHLDQVLLRQRHVAEVSVEEFVDGDEEYTFDAIVIDGVVVYHNVTQYFPRPLIARSEEWVSPAQATPRDLDQPHLAGGISMGHDVVRALGMQTGFVHMEWFRNTRGDVVFGEIGCRSGGGHLVDQMNFTGDVDLFREWSRAVCWKTVEPCQARRWNVSLVFKRARGQGRIQRIEGLEGFRRRWGRHLFLDQLSRPGTPRRDWKQTLVSDGFVVLRHADWDGLMAVQQDFTANVHLYAG